LQVKLQEEEMALKKRVMAARKKLEDSDISGIENFRQQKSIEMSSSKRGMSASKKSS